MYRSSVFWETSCLCPECGEPLWMRYSSKVDCLVCRNPDCMNVFPIDYEQLEIDVSPSELPLG